MRLLILTFALAAVPLPLSAQSTSFDMARSASLAPGDWRYEPTGEGSRARYSKLFEIRCARAARLVVLRRLDISTPVQLTIATDALTRSLPTSGTLGTADRLLDAIAFSRGRFLVNGGSAQRLVLPASPEAARSIEDCRN
jgi:hypothetical protein